MLLIDCARRNDSAAKSDLLLLNGGFYVGQLDEEDWRPNGLGTEFNAYGAVGTSGEWRDGKLHGFGVKWEWAKRLQECGRFEDGELVESRTVPLSKVPAGPVHNKKGQLAAQLMLLSIFLYGSISC